MADKIRITTPLTEEQSRKLKVGDSVPYFWRYL